MWLTLLPLLLKAKTWFLARRVQLVKYLLIGITALGLLVGAYQLGKMRAEHACQLQRVQSELQSEQAESEFLLNLQKETVGYYRDQMTFNQSFVKRLDQVEGKTIERINTIYKESPVVEVYDPCNASIEYSIIRMRNEAGAQYTPGN